MSAAPPAALGVALGIALGVSSGVSLGAPAAAQPADARAPAGQLADRVARAGDGPVRFRYAVREGVCGDGARGVTIAGPEGESHYGTFTRNDGGGPWTARCEPGPARVTLAVRGGVPRLVRLTVGGRPGPADDDAAGADLGAVPAAAAAAYLLDLAARADAPAPGQTLLGAVVADSAVVWPRLLDLARGGRAPSATRREATFWASRYACDAAARAGRAARERPDTADREVRRQVVFALSQRPDDGGTAALTRVARADRDPAVRCAALFWLGQGVRGRAADASTLDLFEDVLRGR